MDTYIQFMWEAPDREGGKKENMGKKTSEWEISLQQYIVFGLDFFKNTHKNKIVLGKILLCKMSAKKEAKVPCHIGQHLLDTMGPFAPELCSWSRK